MAIGPSVDELVAENARLRGELDAAALLIVQLTSATAAFEAQMSSQAERIAALEELLAEARRAGKRQAAPFSKGDPKAEPNTPGRKKGGAHGKHGHRMAPVGEPDRDLAAGLPDGCPHCGHDQFTLGEVADQWVTDFVVVPVRTRFRVQIGCCDGCGRRVQGRHPEQTSDALGAAGSQIGPNAKALALWLHYAAGLSFGRCSKALAMLGVEVTRGALTQAAAGTSKAMVPTYQALLERVARSPMVVMDETGWRIGGNPAWLWNAVTPEVTVYAIAQGEGARGFDAGTKLVPAGYDGTIVRDGWAPYRNYTAATHQTCLAHLLRRCDRLLTDLPGWAVGTPRYIKALLHEALDARDLPAGQRQHVIEDLTERVELLIEAPHPHDENRKLVGHLAREADALFTFLDDSTIDATNWRAEQGVRPAVVNRKTFGGNRTDAGARTQEIISSVLTTAHQQGHDILALLVGLARAPAPTVLHPLTTP